VQNIHAYLHEVAGVFQQINNRGTETQQSATDFDTNGNESESATAALSVALYRGFVINGHRCF
jgi:hypothetical protein